jgi:hypothetical protein
VEPIIVHAASFGVVRAFRQHPARGRFPTLAHRLRSEPVFRPITGRSAERAAELGQRRGALGHGERDLLGFEAP